jgi:electron transport complex protein RnfA
MNLGTVFAILIGVIFVNNFVFSRFLGLCPYLGVSKDTSSAIGMGMAVIFVMTMASIVTWPLYRYFLAPDAVIKGLELAKALRTTSFILVIASLVQFIEMLLQKVNPALYKALGIYLPIITTNCAILGVAVLNIDTFFKHGKPVPGSYLGSIVQGFGAGLGFTLAMILMSSVRERMEMANIPKPLQGIPIAFITAGLMSMAFLGFSGLIK